MQLRHRVALGAAQLDEIDNRIVIQGVSTAAGKTTMNAVSLYGRDGQRLTARQRDSLDVEVSFGLLIRKTDMAARAALLDTVNAWAALAQREYGGAWLSVNYKDNRRIHVYLAEAAAEEDLKDWTNTFRITFRAFGVPYWQEAGAETYTSQTGSIQYGTLRVGGSVKTVVNAVLMNQSGDLINTASITAGSSVIAFSGLGLGAGEQLIVDHDDEGLLRMRILSATNNYRSVYDKRTAGSANDLFVMPGTPAIGFSAQRACSLTASAPGRFL